MKSRPTMAYFCGFAREMDSAWTSQVLAPTILANGRSIGLPLAAVRSATTRTALYVLPAGTHSTFCVPSFQYTGVTPAVPICTGLPSAKLLFAVATATDLAAETSDNTYSP